MNIVGVNINHGLEIELSAQGHRVMSLRITRPGAHALAPLIERRRREDPQWFSFETEAVFQQEQLGSPVLLSDLRLFPVPRAFWSIDSHLNLYWHRHYAALFHTVFTPHVRWWNALPFHQRHQRVCRLAAAGVDRRLRPHNERLFSVGFTGRLTGTRPLRARLAALITEHFDGIVHDNLSYSEMLDFYSNVRLVPNEAICFEVNFRLLEAASCGCCVLSPHIGDDQDVLLEPGTEFLQYNDALELKDLLRFCLRKPQVAESVASAAYKRVQSEHLPRHRAEIVSRELASLSGSVLSDAESAAGFWLSIAQLRRNGRLAVSAETLERRLSEACPDTPVVLTARVYLAAERCGSALPDALLHACLAQPVSEENPIHAAELADLFTACGSAAIQARDFRRALVFWNRYRRAVNEPEHCRPGSFSELCGLWADSLGRRGIQYQPGLIINPEKYCETALDMALAASCLDGSGTVWADSLLRLDEVRRCLPELALGASAHLNLHRPRERRYGLDYALLCLRCFRTEEGLDEIRRLLSEGDSAEQDEICRELLLREGGNRILNRLGGVAACVHTLSVSADAGHRP